MSGFGILGTTKPSVDDIADVLEAGVGTADLARVQSAVSEPAVSLLSQLPNFAAAIRAQNDASPATLRIIGLGSSVGLGPDGALSPTDSPSAYFAGKLTAKFDLLSNLDFVHTNGSVGGTGVQSAVADYAAAKTAAGGTPILVVASYGMNDGMPALYHSGGTYPGAYFYVQELAEVVRADGADLVLCTTPHPLTTDSSWYQYSGPVTYPGSEIPNEAGSVVTGDFSGLGVQIEASYRHFRWNQQLRAAAAELGVPVIDAERGWFRAIALQGQAVLYTSPQFNHPNLLGMQVSYGQEIDYFVGGLVKSRTMPSNRSQISTRAKRRISISSGATVIVPVPVNSVGRILVSGSSGGGWHSVWHGSWVSSDAGCAAGVDGSAFIAPGQLIALVTGSASTLELAISTTATGSAGVIEYVLEVTPRS